jgi:hypothetical protein
LHFLITIMIIQTIPVNSLIATLWKHGGKFPHILELARYTIPTLRDWIKPYKSVSIAGISGDWIRDDRLQNGGLCRYRYTNLFYTNIDTELVVLHTFGKPSVLEIIQTRKWSIWHVLGCRCSSSVWYLLSTV